MEFIPVTGSLHESQPKENLYYFVNFSKMNSVNDLIVVLQALGFGISSNHPLFNQVKPFLDLDKGVQLPPKNM
jgi:hypothetical protein